MLRHFKKSSINVIALIVNVIQLGWKKNGWAGVVYNCSWLTTAGSTSLRVRCPDLAAGKCGFIPSVWVRDGCKWRGSESLVMITLHMDLFSCELFGSVLSDVGILVLLLSVAEFCCLIIYWNWEVRSEKQSSISFLPGWICHLLMAVYPPGPVLGGQNFASYWFYYFMHF